MYTFIHSKDFSPSDHQDHELLESQWNLALQAPLSDPINITEKMNPERKQIKWGKNKSFESSVFSLIKRQK